LIPLAPHVLLRAAKILDGEWIVSGSDARDSTDILLGIHLVGSITAAQAENLKSPMLRASKSAANTHPEPAAQSI
jgi:hypothetical protein